GGQVRHPVRARPRGSRRRPGGIQGSDSRWRRDDSVQGGVDVVERHDPSLSPLPSRRASSSLLPLSPPPPPLIP
ncbi:hypothetical protein PRIPAC_91162, partial [Pristionchus pacificus]